MNHFYAVGIVKCSPEIKETDKGIHYCNLVLDVKRSFKNIDEMYDKDELCITLWRSIADNTVSLVRVGDVIELNGRIQSSIYNKEDGSKYYNYELIAEKVFVIEGSK